MNNIIKRKWNQNSMVIIEDLQGMAFQAESGGHTFQISGIDGEGDTVALSGTPAGVMLRADGQDVTLTCSVSGGVVSATLPANAYSVPGRFGLTIFLTSDGQKTAIYAAVGTVGKTSSGTVAPPAGSDVVTLVNQINTAIAAIPANYNACFAPAYSTSGLYSVGQYVTYNGNLYRCNTAITTAETWTAAHWTQTNLGADVYDLKSALTFEQKNKIDIASSQIIQGSYTASGQVDPNPKRIRTVGFIPVYNGMQIDFTPGTKAKQMFYGKFNEAQQFIADGSWISGGTLNVDWDGYTILVFRTGDVNISPSDYDATTTLVSADGKNKKEVETLKEELNRTEKSIGTLFNDGEYYLFPIWEQGYLDSSTGAEGFTTASIRTQFMSVYEYKTFILSLISFSALSEAKVYFYRNDKSYISNKMIASGTTLTAEIPDGSAYARVQLANWSSTINPLDANGIVDNAKIIPQITFGELENEIKIGLQARDIKSVITNEDVYFLDYASKSYPSGSTYSEKLIYDGLAQYIQPGEYYTLYCGDMIVPVSTGHLRLYIIYTDSSYDRVEVYKNRKYSAFKSNADKTIASVKLYAVPVNGGGSTASAGDAEYANIYIFKGEKLNLQKDFVAYNITEDIPNYYMQHIETKEGIIRGLQKDCSFNGDSLVFLTDTHYDENYFLKQSKTYNYYNTNNSIPLINHVMRNTAVRQIVFGGDLINSTSGIDEMIHGMSLFGSMFGDSKGRVMYCVGNHEYYTDLGQQEENRPTDDWLYGGFAKYNEERIEGKAEMDTYYYDNKVQKIRYFIIGCGRDTETTIDQAKWVLDQFTKVPDDYKIICIGHAFLFDDMSSFRGNYNNIIEGMDAVNSGTTYEYYGEIYDYSALNNVEAVCAITGHTHIDGYLLSQGGTLCICTTCDSYKQNCVLESGEPHFSPRSTGGIDEQAFDVIQFDFDNKLIYCTRIGFGSDRTFRYGANAGPVVN